MSRLPLLLLLGACSDYELKAEAEPDAPAETAGSPDIDCPSEVDFGSQPLAELLRGAWAVDLGGRGVRDLARAPDGTLLILAGPAPDGPGPHPTLGPSDADGTGAPADPDRRWI